MQQLVFAEGWGQLCSACGGTQKLVNQVFFIESRDTSVTCL
jgi:hypothetical protein